MARKAQTMVITINCTVAPDQQSATVDNAKIELGGTINDARATGVAVTFPAEDEDAWDGTKSGSVIVADCLSKLKTKYGI